MKQTDFAYYLTKYLTEYLPGQRNVSSNTLRSYRDVMKQFLLYLNEKHKLKPEKICLTDITSDVIVLYLEWLEKNRKVSISTRNQRLAAIHSFFRYLQSEIPDILFESQKILGIPFKKAHKEPVGYLEQVCIQSLLRQPDTRTIRGIRDCAILVVLYDSAARIQELIDLKVKDVRLTNPATIKLTGKGNKTRIIPLMDKTSAIIESYMSMLHLQDNGNQLMPLFYNSRIMPFTRPGITYILKKYYKMAMDSDNSLPWKTKIHPHLLRHSKAVHMLEADVPLIYIRDYLGHVSITTTEIYLKTMNRLKREALEKTYPQYVESIPPWSENKGLIEWLDGLCK
jgi:site-specific recombinase XerD